MDWIDISIVGVCVGTLQYFFSTGLMSPYVSRMLSCVCISWNYGYNKCSGCNGNLDMWHLSDSVQALWTFCRHHHNTGELNLHSCFMQMRKDPQFNLCSQREIPFHSRHMNYQWKTGSGHVCEVFILIQMLIASRSEDWSKVAMLYLPQIVIYHSNLGSFFCNCFIR